MVHNALGEQKLQDAGGPAEALTVQGADGTQSTQMLQDAGGPEDLQEDEVEAQKVKGADGARKLQGLGRPVETERVHNAHGEQKLQDAGGPAEAQTVPGADGTQSAHTLQDAGGLAEAQTAQGADGAHGLQGPDRPVESEMVWEWRLDPDWAMKLLTWFPDLAEADIGSICKEAAILAARRAAPAIEMQDVKRAGERVMGGPAKERKPREKQSRDKR